MPAASFLSQFTSVMKVSICIPQYNRIEYLLKSLQRIEKQAYENIEVVVSDDCSTDDTEGRIKELQTGYRYPLVYKKNRNNLGYDRNYRQSIELASGDYCFILGNDDTLNAPDAIRQLVDFLQRSGHPDIGFCNYFEEHDPANIYRRAHTTGILGSGYEVAMKNYSCFSFVAGLIYKKETFMQYNTPAYDGSVFAQMYLGCLMIAKGCLLFSIEEPLVIKDIRISNQRPNNYRDTLARDWKDYKEVDAGLPSVMNVLIGAFRDAGVLNQSIIYNIHKKIYALTYPHWLLDYRSNGAYPAAKGLSIGLKPSSVPTYALLTPWNKRKIALLYRFSTLVGLKVPVSLFNKLKVKLYSFIKKK